MSIGGVAILLPQVLLILSGRTWGAGTDEDEGERMTKKSKLVAVHLSTADRRTLSRTRKPRGRIESVERGDHGPKTTIRVVYLGH